MALIRCNFFSEVLNLQTSMTVILPDHKMDGGVRPGYRHPTLYLLHGYSDDDTIWLRRTSIERYAADFGLAVIMPQVHRSFYTDMEYGYPYWTFLSKELPEIARAYFPLSAAREDNFVAGLSMGGYGAMKWALRCPGQFAAAASLSGALNIASRQDSALSKQLNPDFQLIFGGKDIAGTENDVIWLLEQASRNGGEMPQLYQICGTEDFLYAENTAFRQACGRLGIPLTYEEGPGDHTWAYWDAKIQDVLNWLPLRK